MLPSVGASKKAGKYMVTGLLSYDHLELVGGSGGGSWGLKTFSCMRTHAKQHAYYKMSFFRISMEGVVA